MNDRLMSREQLLSELADSIVIAANFFIKVDENLFDGHQTAREVLSHLLFWHREYSAIAHALLLGENPTLLTGTLAQLNAQAICNYQEQDMVELANCLVEEHKTLDLNLRRLDDWNVNFPFKKGCRKIDVAGRICFINTHIRHHIVRQERACRRGGDWIKAYYLDPSS